MADSIRQAGFLAFQETSVAGMLRFCKARSEAEIAAKQMLDKGQPVIVIPVVRFTTRQIQRTRKDAE